MSLFWTVYCPLKYFYYILLFYVYTDVAFSFTLQDSNAFVAGLNMIHLKDAERNWCFSKRAWYGFKWFVNKIEWDSSSYRDLKSNSRLCQKRHLRYKKSICKTFMDDRSKTFSNENFSRKCSSFVKIKTNFMRQLESIVKYVFNKK